LSVKNDLQMKGMCRFFENQLPKFEIILKSLQKGLNECIFDLEKLTLPNLT
jgi:hypothetical protein